MAEGYPWNRRFSAAVTENTCTLRAEECGVLTRIVDRLQAAGRPLNDDMTNLSACARVTRRKWAKIRELLVREGHLTLVSHKGRPSISCDELERELEYRAQRSVNARKSALSAPKKATFGTEKPEELERPRSSERSAFAGKNREDERREEPGPHIGPGSSTKRMAQLIQRVGEVASAEFVRAYILPAKLDGDGLVPRTMIAYGRLRRAEEVMEQLRSEGIVLVSPTSDQTPVEGRQVSDGRNGVETSTHDGSSGASLDELKGKASK